MQTLVSTLLLATTLSGAVQPAPLDWTETPTGPERAVLYTADKAGNAFWSVGITLEQVGEATAFHPLALRWDGKNWLQTEPAIPDGRLDDVLVRSANDVQRMACRIGGCLRDRRSGQSGATNRRRGLSLPSRCCAARRPTSTRGELPRQRA